MFTKLSNDTLCICGHSMEHHHLMFSMKEEGVVVASECLAYGSNEDGGMMPGENGEWIEHCYKFKEL